jgi:hypothetical protein
MHGAPARRAARACVRTQLAVRLGNERALPRARLLARSAPASAAAGRGGGAGATVWGWCRGRLPAGGRRCIQQGPPRFVALGAASALPAHRARRGRRRAARHRARRPGQVDLCRRRRSLHRRLRSGTAHARPAGAGARGRARLRGRVRRERAGACAPEILLRGVRPCSWPRPVWGASLAAGSVGLPRRSMALPTCSWHLGLGLRKPVSSLETAALCTSGRLGGTPSLDARGRAGGVHGQAPDAPDATAPPRAGAGSRTACATARAWRW